MNTLINTIAPYFTLSWDYLRDLLDILIVASIFYLVYKFLFRTRAIQLLKGIVIISLISIIAVFLKLETLEWLIKNFTTYVVITLVVLFQPELRRLLTQFGQRNWLGDDSSKETLPLDELVNALISMGEEKIGSLIVIERNSDLRVYIESGVTVNALTSEEFIKTIFYPLTPLHDGAIIMKAGKILAAACYLPLSNSKQLKKYHGARHRAALGIAEETDALVLVTSEENGNISLAVNGKIYSKIKNSDLKNMILYFLNPKTAYENDYKI